MINQVVEPIGKNFITKTNLKMKSITIKLSLILLAILISGTVISQGVVISDDANATPHGSAMLDLQSVDKGFLPPRMTTLDRTNIVNPASGLVVYDTDKESLFLFNGTEWKPLATDSGSQWEADGEDIYRNTGNVGIGTDSPNTLLHTKGLGTGQGNILFEGEAKLLLPPMYGPTPASGPGTRLMWYPDKVAFRVGLVTDSQWDSALIGPNSYAFGINPIASGHSSIAFGRETYAPSFNETVIGAYNTSYTPQGIGLFSWNGSDRLFVVGNGTAENQRSDALVLLKNGNFGLGTSFPQTTMHINGSFRYENGNQAEGKVLTSDEFGNVTWADPTSGVEIDPVFNASPAVSIGNSDINNWNDAFSWGDHNQAGYLLEENDPTVATIQPGSVPRWNGAELEDSDVYIQNGQLGIGTVTPDALLHVNGTGTGEGNVLFVGEYKFSDPGPAPIEGGGTRMMWYPDKAAFRAGRVNGSHWDTDSIGNYSFAFGVNTKATATYSTAIGYINIASGQSSTALGYRVEATGTRSTAIGHETKATSANSTAMGSRTIASGLNSTAMGNNTRAYGTASSANGDFVSAYSYAEVAIGRWNTSYTPEGITAWNSNDRLFVIGNGINQSIRKDAMVVMKNGNTGIGISTPNESLEVDGNIHVSGGNRTIFNRSSNSLAFGTSNTERMLITSGGNVGVGTNSPGALLHVERTSSSSSPQFRIHNSSATGFARLRLTNEAHEHYWDIASGGTNNYLDFYHNGNGGSMMTLRPDLRFVGIRTINPTFTLHVNGDAGKPGGGSWANASDARLKSDVQDLQGSLENLLKLRGVTFIYNDPETIHELPGKRTGMIAQEVAEVFPDWVSEANDGYLRLTYRGFEALMVEALRELREEKDAEIQTLNLTIQKLNSELQSLGRNKSELSDRLGTLETMLGQILLRQQVVDADTE
jgi:hypothetical protein